MKTNSMRLRIRRTSGWQEYMVQVSPDAYVMDALEAAGSQDASLLYRHSCHHASCGSCGIRINGREGLPCITPLRQYTSANRVIRLEPLRNFPLIGDLLVDFGPFMKSLDSVGLPLRRDAESLGTSDQGVRLEHIEGPAYTGSTKGPSTFNRLENCIECGLCVSACPVAGLDAHYAGPAVLAAAGRIVAEPREREVREVIRRVDREQGLWRCHAAFECSEVCPAGVDPAGEIMRLRGELLRPSAAREAKGRA